MVIRHDLPFGYGMAQDREGFIWVDATDGLYRYDGSEARRWGQSAGINFEPVVTGPRGEVVALGGPNDARTLYRVVGDNVEAVNGPTGQPFDLVLSIAFTSDGRLWVARANALFYRDENQPWVSVQFEAPGQERVRHAGLTAGLNGVLLVVTTGGLWQVAPDGTVSRLLANPALQWLLAHTDGSIFVGEGHPAGWKILQLRDGRVTERYFRKGQIISFVQRGQTVWAGYTGAMIILRLGAEPEVLEVERDEPLCAALMPDREGCLWCIGGQFHYPEPDSALWTFKDGLPLSPFGLRQTGEGIWVSGWYGLGRLARVENQWRARKEGVPNIGRACVDGRGVLWSGWARQPGSKPGRWIKHEYGGQWACAPASDGTVWITNDRGLFRTRPNLAAPRALGKPFGAHEGYVLEDRQGRLWLTGGDRICHAPAAAVNAGRQVDWSCQTLEGARAITDVKQLPSGGIWVSTVYGGVWRYDDGNWKVIPASRNPPGAHGVVIPSRSGGVWVLGIEPLRVIERPDLPEGWQVVERLSSWQGLATRYGVTDLLEEPDGSLWLVSVEGVIHMSAEARRAKIEPPPVKLVDLIINGQRAALDQAQQIAAGHNLLELRFAALTFRNRSLLRWQYRLRPNAPWTDANHGAPVFRFVDLSADPYTAEVRASLDGVNWSPETARISFEVLRAWYLRWWALTLAAITLGVSVYGVHRMRVATLLQLERQRARIAMDLHDELGSGLGSIGLLSGVAADEHLDNQQRLSLSRQIAETAGDLSASLTDVVWALRTDANTLEGLAVHLTRRGQGLFPNRQPAFETDFPDEWPDVQLTPTLRRNLFLIAMEAMHNAARHAHASRVVLGIAPSGRQWRLWIADDGCGLRSNDDTSGTGLMSLRQRAVDIGARLAWQSQSGVGTTVTVIFKPR